LDRNGPLRSTYLLQATQDPNAWDARDERSMDRQPTRTESLAPLSDKVSSNPIESDLSLNLSRGTCGFAPGREEMHRSPNSPGSLDRSVQPNSIGYQQGSDAHSIAEAESEGYRLMEQIESYFAKVALETTGGDWVDSDLIEGDAQPSE